VQRERLVARARGRVLDIAEQKDWATSAELELHSYDTIVSVFQLCTADDVYSTLLRVAELLKPDGQLLVLEHVRSTGWRGRVQDAAAPLWRRAAGRCRLNRDVVDLLRQNGFAVTDCDRFTVDGATPLVRHAVSAVAIRKVRDGVATK
jgi:SAM-dependent methyltransferase